VSGKSRAESQVGVRLMGVWRVSYSNIQEFFFYVLCISDPWYFRSLSGPLAQARCGSLIEKSDRVPVFFYRLERGYRH
jgi:hypothetical protein